MQLVLCNPRSTPLSKQSLLGPSIPWNCLSLTLLHSFTRISSVCVTQVRQKSIPDVRNNYTCPVCDPSPHPLLLSLGSTVDLLFYDQTMTISILTLTELLCCCMFCIVWRPLQHSKSKYVLTHTAHPLGICNPTEPVSLRWTCALWKGGGKWRRQGACLQHEMPRQSSGQSDAYRANMQLLPEHCLLII